MINQPMGNSSKNGCRFSPTIYKDNYVVGSKIFRADQLFKVTEIKQLCYFST